MEPPESASTDADRLAPIRPGYDGPRHALRRPASQARRNLAAQPATVAAPIGAVGVAFFVVQAALGWGLGIAGAGLTVLVAVSILSVLVVTDALAGIQTAATDDRYNVVVCAGAAIAVAIAIACLYLPMPWGGLCAATVLAGLVVALRVL